MTDALTPRLLELIEQWRETVHTIRATSWAPYAEGKALERAATILDLANELTAALREAQPADDSRLRRLARQKALENHIGCFLARANGHVYRENETPPRDYWFDECPHPDCAALHEAGGMQSARACSCAEPDPVMQADGWFYCHQCSFQTGARPRNLEPEDAIKRYVQREAENAQTEKKS